jgi:hypothetical protein
LLGSAAYALAGIVILYATGFAVIWFMMVAATEIPMD